MKSTGIIFLILIASLSLYRFSCPTDFEQESVQWRRQARQEQEQISREALTIREDINRELSEIEKGVNKGVRSRERDLEKLKTRLEKENRDLQEFAHDASDFTRDSWVDLKNRARENILEVRQELFRVREGLTEAMSSNEK